MEVYGYEGHSVSHRVFLIDDQPVVREGLKATLSAHGMQVVGETTTRILQDVQPCVQPCDVVVVDPEHASEPAKLVDLLLAQSAPLMILSAVVDGDAVISSLRRGVRGYLVKWADVDDLIRGIREVARGGAYLHPQVAAAVLDAVRRAPSEHSPLPPLTRRERTTLQLLVGGATNGAIAETLHVSASTIKGTISDLYALFGAKGRSRLVAHVMQSPELKRALDSDDAALAPHVRHAVCRSCSWHRE